MRQFHWILLLLILSGCATFGVFEYNDLYGKTDPDNRLSVPRANPVQRNHFNQIVKPIIENRCVVCHGCYDAPCQLKMENNAAIERGANKSLVYNGERLLTAKSNHSLSTIAKLDKEQLLSFRNNDFFPVLNERHQTPAANTSAGLMYQILQLKQQYPLPEAKLLDDSFDVSLNRNQYCPTIEEFDKYQKNFPLAGMPYGLPGLLNTQHQQLSTWIKNGAIFPTPPPPSTAELTIIQHWETWLNNPNYKQQLVSRYLFEHLYLANLIIDKSGQNFFKMVRSSTPPGKKVKLINTRRPFDSPFQTTAKEDNLPAIYYRLLKNHDTIIAKRHMPYQFDLDKLAYLQNLFIEPNYQVRYLPDYQLLTASNPFKTFRAIPAKLRYKFLLDQAQFSIKNFIKGPVCRGQIAINVIEDHFWVFFADPKYIDKYHGEAFIDASQDLLQLPAGTSDKALSVLYWRSYAKRQTAYIHNKLDNLKQINFSQSDLDLNLIWSGEGNPNASLTIFRHFDSASVLQGFIGQTPKTAWFITYPLLERIHYLLVAGFDVYGNVGHQLKTRLYMDFLRMEAESNFIALLPKNVRLKTHEYWYRNTKDDIKAYIFSDDFYQLPETNIQYSTDNPKQELLAKVAIHTQNKHVNSYNLTATKSSQPSDLKLIHLNKMRGKAVAILPQVSHLLIRGKQGDQVYSLINNSAFTNVAHLFAEDSRRVPAEDNLTVISGIVGTYPNAFFQVDEQQLDEFINGLIRLQTEQDYTVLKDKFGVRRTSKNFWQFADKLHLWYRQHQGNAAGLLDFNRLENR